MQQEDKTLSIIVPVYNTKPELLQRCVGSILAQTFRALEVIVVDDGSKAEVWQQILGLREQSEKIVAVRKENGGLSSARNYGMQFAHGKFIAFIDSDDWVEPGFYQVLMQEFMDGQVDIAIGGFVVDYGDYKKNILAKAGAGKFDAMAGMRYMYQAIGFNWSAWDKIYRRELLAKLRFDETVFFGEDMLFTYFAFKQARKLAYLPLRGYHYCMNAASMTHSVNPRYLSVFKAHEAIMQDMKEAYPDLADLGVVQYIVRICKFEYDMLLASRHAAMDAGHFSALQKRLRGEVRFLWQRSNFIPWRVRFMALIFMLPKDVLRIFVRLIYQCRCWNMAIHRGK